MPDLTADRLPEAVAQRPTAGRSSSAVRTVPLGRLGTPEEVAAAVCFLAGPTAGYITGHVLAINGGLSM